MRITIDFDTDNSAFEEDFKGELRLTMRRAETQILKLRGYALPDVLKLYDTNGNAVGTVRSGEVPDEDRCGAIFIKKFARTPDGHINNCALHNGDLESNCQICNGTCPDKERYEDH
jgi:hypothetical protein